LEKINQDINAIAESSKGIKRSGQPTRQNFVKINMMKNYKPVSRGAVFTNKIMAKKRNALKFREKFKRKMQIERAKNSEGVNVYGGLGRVGLDHMKKIGNGEDEEQEEELAPGFSNSALKYVKDIIKDIEEEVDEDIDDEDHLLSGDDEVNEELK
jgi:hypothetical protein